MELTGAVPYKSVSQDGLNKADEGITCQPSEEAMEFHARTVHIEWSWHPASELR